MKSKTLTSAVRMLSLFLLVSGTCALAQERRPTHFSGLINDYSPSTVKGGPWEMHGQWTLDCGRNGMVNGSRRRLFSGHDDVRLRELLRRPRRDKGWPERPHPPHQADERRVTWNMTGCPDIQSCHTDGFSVQRYGQPDDRERKQCALRERLRLLRRCKSALPEERGAVLEYFPGLRRAGDDTLRHPGDPRCCAQLPGSSVDPLKRRFLSSAREVQDLPGGTSLVPISVSRTL